MSPYFLSFLDLCLLCTSHTRQIPSALLSFYVSGVITRPVLDKESIGCPLVKNVSVEARHCKLSPIGEQQRHVTPIPRPPPLHYCVDLSPP